MQEHHLVWIQLLKGNKSLLQWSNGRSIVSDTKVYHRWRSVFYQYHEGVLHRGVFQLSEEICHVSSTINMLTTSEGEEPVVDISPLNMTLLAFLQLSHLQLCEVIADGSHLLLLLLILSLLLCRRRLCCGILADGEVVFLFHPFCLLLLNIVFQCIHLRTQCGTLLVAIATILPALGSLSIHTIRIVKVGSLSLQHLCIVVYTLQILLVVSAVIFLYMIVPAVLAHTLGNLLQQPLIGHLPCLLLRCSRSSCLLWLTHSFCSCFRTSCVLWFPHSIALFVL